MGKHFLFLALVLFGAGAARSTEWFTIVGDDENPQVDTAQLDVSSIQGHADPKPMRFRVNLARPRTLDNGEIYQSYVSNIAVECASHSIFHEQQERYRARSWQGPTEEQTFEQPKPMAFGGLAPDLKARVLSAACRGSAGR